MSIIDAEGGLIRTLIVLAGIGHLALALGSLAIPKTLGWREDTAKLKLLTRQVFWTYAGYIWCAHVAFGLLSVLGPRFLLDRSPLAGMGFLLARGASADTISSAIPQRRGLADPRDAAMKVERVLVAALVLNLLNWPAAWAVAR